MEDLVENVLEIAAKKQQSYKTTEVKKDVDVDFDTGNLLASDSNSLDMKHFRSQKEDYLKIVARDDTQLLINRIWELPVEKVEDAIVVKLPEPSTLIPREKPIPKKKATTKWQEYASMKGIQKRKRGQKVWDDELKQWVPRWGYKSKNDEKRDWVLEVPQNADIYEDQFEKKRKEKKERVAKNELQRLRNIARSTKSKVPGVGLTPVEKPDKSYLSRALSAAQKSDASLGRFSNKLPKEDAKAAKIGRKRKFESNTGSMVQEKKRSLDVLNKVLSGNPIVDRTKAANLHLNEEQTKRSKKDVSKSSMKKGKGGKGGGKGGGNKGGGKFKGKMGKGGAGSSLKIGKNNRKQGKRKGK